MADCNLQGSTDAPSIKVCLFVLFISGILFSALPLCTTVYVKMNEPQGSAREVLGYQHAQKRLLSALLALECHALLSLGFDRRILGSCDIRPMLFPEAFLVTTVCCWMMVYHASYNPAQQEESDEESEGEDGEQGIYDYAREYEPLLHEWRTGQGTLFSEIRRRYPGEYMSSSLESGELVDDWLRNDSGYDSG
ncbi:hypothetical protein V8C37DRAFT_379251 [Trichoderma ceciliae]